MVELKEKQVNTWAMLCHLGALLALLLPLFNIIGPLIIWLIMKKKSPFINKAGKESINFQLSVTIYFLIAVFVIWMPSLFRSSALMLTGYALMLILVIFDFIMVIIAGVKNFKGKEFRYPLTIRFIR